MKIKLSTGEKKREGELIDICIKFKGEYRPFHHGSGSFSTTYSNDFLAAFFGLHKLYTQAGYPSPKMRLSNKLIGEGVTSCRGGRMTWDRVDYVFKAHYSRFRQKTE